MTRTTPHTVPYEIQAMTQGRWETITTATTKTEANKARRTARIMHAVVRIVEN